MENKRTYYKLGKNASVFSDNANGLKVTKNIPGSCLKVTKLTKEGAGQGHIIEISKEEWETMMSKVTPKEKELALKEQGIKADGAADNKGAGASKKDEDEDEEAIEKEIRDGLLKRLGKLQMTKSKREEAKAMSTPDLQAFIEAEEKA